MPFLGSFRNRRFIGAKMEAFLTVTWWLGTNYHSRRCVLVVVVPILVGLSMSLLAVICNVSACNSVQFVDEKGAKKGLKLDFKYISVVEESLKALEDFDGQVQV